MTSTTYKYCKGHGYLALSGADVKAEARECEYCTVIDRVENDATPQ